MRSVYVVLGCIAIPVGLGWVVVELMNGENIWRRYSAETAVLNGPGDLGGRVPAGSHARDTCWRDC
jgi:hypothetical protein